MKPSGKDILTPEDNSGAEKEPDMLSFVQLNIHLGIRIVEIRQRLKSLGIIKN